MKKIRQNIREKGLLEFLLIFSHLRDKGSIFYQFLLKLAQIVSQ